MLSTLTIISIFAEIFAAGIFLVGALTLFKSFLSFRKLKALYLGLFFLAFFAYVFATIISQMMFNLGWELSRLIEVQKAIAISLVLSSLFLFAFTLEIFGAKKLRWSNLLALFLSAVLSYRVLESSANLIYREGIIEPIVVFSSAVPFKPFFALVTFLSLVAAFLAAFSSTGGRRTLSFYLGFSNILLLGALLSAFLYGRFGEAGYLLASWVLVLISGFAASLFKDPHPF